MSPDEERLVVDLHARWGNRWSRIAKAMPGRTDNEIKNYWRTHTRKLPKNSASASASTTTSMSMSMSAASPATTSTSSSSSMTDNGDQETPASHEQADQDQELLYTAGVGAMDSNLLWNDAIVDAYAWGAATAPSMIVPPTSSPVWDYNCSDLLWGIGDDEVEYKKMLAVAGAS